MVVTYSFVYLVPIVLIEVGRAPLVRILRRAPRPTRAQVHRLTGVAIPSLVRGTAWAAVIGLDVFFVEIFAPESLASYAADRTLAVPMTIVPWALTVLILPRSVSASATARWHLLARALKVSTVISAALSALYIAFGPLALRLLFPADYSDAGGDPDPRARARAHGRLRDPQRVVDRHRGGRSRRPWPSSPAPS